MHHSTVHTLHLLVRPGIYNHSRNRACRLSAVPCRYEPIPAITEWNIWRISGGKPYLFHFSKIWKHIKGIRIWSMCRIIYLICWCNAMTKIIYEISINWIADFLIKFIHIKINYMTITAYHCGLRLLTQGQLTDPSLNSRFTKTRQMPTKSNDTMIPYISLFSHWNCRHYKLSILLTSLEFYCTVSYCLCPWH